MEAPLRRDHDPSRPAVSTSQAAERLGVSRFHVAESVKSGSLAGYGIPAKERTRWFVYADALDSGSEAHRTNADLLSNLRALRDKVAHVQTQRRDSRKLLLGVYDSAIYAEESPRLREIMLSVNDSERLNFVMDNDLAEVHGTLVRLIDDLADGGSAPS